MLKLKIQVLDMKAYSKIIRNGPRNDLNRRNEITLLVTEKRLRIKI
jgi:hypothetical protein